MTKNPKPQRIVVPASGENSVQDMIGAYSDAANHQLPTTFKPNFPTNHMKTTYTAPVTTFHPKATVQTVSAYNPRTTAHTVANMYPRTTMHTGPHIYPNPTQTFLTYQPKSTMQTMTNMYPKSTAQTVPRFHPRQTLQTVANFQPKTTFEPPVSSYHPKATLQTISANSIPTDFVSTYHPKTATYKVTQESNVASTQLDPKFSSRYNVQTTYFTPTVTPSIRPNVKNMLASIGLEPDDSPTIASESQKVFSTITGPTTERPTTSTATTTTTTTTPKPELTPELRELLESFGLLTNEEPPAHVTAGAYQDEFHPIFPSSLKDESLSVSEFKPLPKSVTASDIEGKIESSLEIKPDDFSSFKPLPVPEEKTASDEELEKLLKTYGLLEEDERGSKAIDAEIEKLNEGDSEEVGSETYEVTVKPYKKISEVPEVDVGFLSPDLAKVLGNMGVKSVNQQVKSTTPVITRRIDTTEPAEYSTGQSMSSTMKDDYQKLHLLLDTIRQLDNLNANLTEEELDRLNLKNFNLSKDTLLESEGPDPTYDVQSATKNEVKRQTNSSEPTRIQLDITGTTQSSSSSSSTSDDNDDADDATKTDDEDITKFDDTKADDKTSESPNREGKNEKLETESDDETESSSPSSTSTSSTTEESRNGSISDLAGSFGGNDSGLDPVSEEPLPPPRKNGFYFFSDWNSFLEVGEDPDKVIVRFDPKIGDPSQFVKVKTP